MVLAAAVVSGNSAYWYFVVVTWLPVWAFLYLAPRS
jgi:heme/copper-type cytochrome/quinol oxidase subunit 3